MFHLFTNTKLKENMEKNQIKKLNLRGFFSKLAITSDYFEHKSWSKQLTNVGNDNEAKTANWKSTKSNCGPTSSIRKTAANRNQSKCVQWERK